MIDIKCDICDKQIPAGKEVDIANRMKRSGVHDVSEICLRCVKSYNKWVDTENKKLEKQFAINMRLRMDKLMGKVRERKKMKREHGFWLLPLDTMFTYRYTGGQR